jgi:hypothetical protein
MDAMQEPPYCCKSMQTATEFFNGNAEKRRKLQNSHPCIRMMPSTQPLGFGLDGSRIGSGSARIVARSFIDLGCLHLPCDVSHLLGDVVPASPSFEPLELRIDVDGGLSVEPRRTELGVGRAMA